MEIAGIKTKRDKLEQEFAAKKVERAEMETPQQYIPKWRDVLEAASIAKRKMMLRTIIGGIRVYHDRVEVAFKLRWESVVVGGVMCHCLYVNFTHSTHVECIILMV
ncbi:hypothetical protein [Paenibacillus mendelii]|uniref:Uncharacterized protein n=1 Tax=Paenibacillus mendelii TaxID=206163 RepID=A0ABV6JFP3_9BACL|nr:hypothetical protein [Paenibacillus mendelii]MCQ6557566.1 hypothetical protein [Paenibacillus mendelii]